MLQKVEREQGVVMETVAVAFQTHKPLKIYTSYTQDEWNSTSNFKMEKKL